MATTTFTSCPYHSRTGPVPTDSVVLHAATQLAQPNLGRKGDPLGLLSIGIIATVTSDNLNRISMLAFLCFAAIGGYQAINPALLDARAQLLAQATKQAELDPA